jgi:long-chain fatty acid transport protein
LCWLQHEELINVLFNSFQTSLASFLGFDFFLHYFTPQGHAAGIGLHEQSAAAISESYAGVAAGSAGLSSMFWNPATLSQNQGLQSSLTLSALLPYANQTTSSQTTQSINPAGFAQHTGDDLSFQALPAGYLSYQLDNNVWVGLSVNAPFGLNSKNPLNWAGAIYGATSEFSSENINPNIALKLNDQLTIAAGLQLEHVRARLTSAISPQSTATNWITGNGWGAGFTLGATYYLSPQTIAGLGYRSRVFDNLGGRESISFAGLANTPISSTIILPDEITFGLSHQVNDVWQIDLGYEYSHWSLFNSFPVTGGYTGQALNFAYHDSWLASAGLQYHWDQALTLKAGGGYETSPIDDLNRGVRVPDAHRLWVSSGLSYKVNTNFSFDAGYAHVFIGDGNVSISGSNPSYLTGAPMYFGSTKAHADIITLGLNYRWF